MFWIWTGPYHLDFKLELEKSKLCRVALNFKISQECHLVIENLMTEFLPQKKAFLEERFTYSIEAIVKVIKNSSDRKWNHPAMPIMFASRTSRLTLLFPAIRLKTFARLLMLTILK
jgi:hypothetical protein